MSLKKADEEALRRIQQVLGDYITFGNETRARRKLQALKLNFGRKLSGKKRKKRVLKKFELSKELI